ncbi:MAG: AMP-binding protein [Deltaproteobacteria bacterium]|nr:AMP-binding protein [Deltaproteobacteria bacterium]
MEGRKSMTTGLDERYKEKGDTWPQILKFNYEQYGLRTAMRHKHYGIWQTYTWKDYYLNVKGLALGLLSLGFQPGDKLLIIGDNAPHYYYSELAAQADHGVSVGLYSELTPEEIKIIAVNAEAVFAVVEDQEQVDKFFQIKEDLPFLKNVIFWNHKGLAHYKDPILMGYEQVLEKGKEYEKAHTGIFEQNVASGKADDICAIVYTSGTTGSTPKGALHTYQTMRAGTDLYLSLDPWLQQDNVVPYLPPAWMAEQWFGIGCHLLSACALNFAESPATQQRDTHETNPSIVIYRAGIWESQAANVHARILDADPVKRFAFRKLMPIGYRMVEKRRQRQKPGLGLRTLYALADMMLFRHVRKSLGLSNARICYTSGSTLSPDAFRFYHALKLPLKSLYWSTEGGVLSGAMNDDIHPDTVGPVREGVEIRIAQNGELIYRQAGTFIGYQNNPEETSHVFKDGWFYSGDSVSVRDDKHIMFLDRVTDLLVLANGRQLAPQFVESRLRFSPSIRDAWIIPNPDNDYLAAVIVIDYENVSRWAGQNRVPYTAFDDLSQRPEVYDLIKKDIDRINQDLPSDARIKKYVHLNKEFNPNKGELTRNRKLRKAFLRERYQTLIDAVCQDKIEVPIESPVTSGDGQTNTVTTTLHIHSI